MVMSRRGTLSPRYPVLGLLMQGPMHGYELYRQYCEDLAPMWRVGIGRVYALLRELESTFLQLMIPNIKINSILCMKK